MVLHHCAAHKILLELSEGSEGLKLFIALIARTLSDCCSDPLCLGPALLSYLRLLVNVIRWIINET